MNPSFYRALCTLLFLGPLTLAFPAEAQDIAAAEALFNKGMAEMDAGRYETGCTAIAESQRLDPRAGTLFTLATCEERWGRVATAVTRFGDYLTLYDRLTPEQKARQGDRARVAKEEKEKLAADIPELTLSLLPGAPAGTVVQRNGAVVAGAALDLPLPVDPGDYLVSTQAPGGEVWEQKVSIAKGEKKRVTLQVKAAAPVRPPVVTPPPATTVPGKPAPAVAKVSKPAPAPGKAGPSGRQVAAYVTGGVGLAGLALGGAMGGLALAKKGTVGEHCGSTGGFSKETDCDQTGLDAVSGGRTFGLVSTIGFAVGGAGVVTAAVLFLTEPRRAKAAVGTRGRWISAGVLSVGPDGAAVGAHGAW